MKKFSVLRGVLPLVFQLALGAAAVTCGTGCGALSALTNPKAAWAISEPAPMSVIVRRAEVAHGTARQVERLLGETGMNDKSKWPAKTALKNADADALLKVKAGEAVYVGAPGAKFRVVPAEAWFDTLSVICSDENKYPSLIASITPELAKSYGEVAAQAKEIAEIKGQIAAEEKALDDKDQAAQKDEHEKKKQELNDKLSKLNDDVGPKKDKFLQSVKDEAGKASPEVKERVGVAVVNLKRAVEDAKIANSVALIRYPMAVPGLKDDAQVTAKRILADVVEERTGQRPDVNNLKIDVKIDGGVKLSVNGVDKLGSLSIDDVVSETTTRLKSYVGRVLTLVAYAGETQELLSFESDVLDALNDGMKIAPSADAGDSIADLKIETGPMAAAGAKKGGEHKAHGARTAVGIAVEPSSCSKPEKPAVVVNADKPEEKVEVKEAKAKPQKKVVEVREAKAPAPAATTHANYERVIHPVDRSGAAESAPLAGSPPPAPVKVEAKPAPKPETKCDVSVTNRDGEKICL